jgi:hypothetical protein
VLEMVRNGGKITLPATMATTQPATQTAGQ